MNPKWVIDSGYLGTETPYQISGCCRWALPKGYHSFYIDHIGRHGARYLSTSLRVETLLEVLEAAKNKGNLTQRGERLREQVMKIGVVTGHQYGLLTPLGKEEERQLGQKMYHCYPEVFGKEVYAVSTYMQRAKQSMFAFLEGLGEYTSSSQFKIGINGQVDPILRFFDVNEAYKKYKKEGDWLRALSHFEERCDLVKKWLLQFFSESVIEALENPVQIGNYIYDLYGNTFNMQLPVGLEAYFTWQQLDYFWQNENVKQFLEKGPGLTGQTLQTNMAYPLLEDFLTSAERAIRKGNISADLRFAHAETLIPLVTLLGVEGYSEQTSDLREVATLWKDSCIAPMAANMWWVFFKGKPEEPILVLPLLNERPVKLPLSAYKNNYYVWDELQHYYRKVLRNLHLPKDVSLIEQVKHYNPLRG